MQVEIFALCDAATVSYGKMNLLGAFDTLYAEAFPARHEDCSVAVRVRFDESDDSSHTLETRIIDIDGQALIPSATHGIETRLREGRTHVHMHIWNIRGLRFPKDGEYWIDLVLDGELHSRIPLYMVQRSPQPPGPLG